MSLRPPPSQTAPWPRCCQEPALWSILAALSIKHGNLQTAEAAYANIDESDKLQYIKYIAEIPTPEGRNAELALFQRRQEDAEQILLQVCDARTGPAAGGGGGGADAVVPAHRQTGGGGGAGGGEWRGRIVY